MRIRSARHRGLKRLIEHDDDREIRRRSGEACPPVLTALQSAQTIDGLTGPPGWRIHRLAGDRAGTWSISVSGNWRITFDLVDDDVHNLNLEDDDPGRTRLPIARAAEVLGVRRATLSDLVNGKAALSPEMALRIEKAFDVSMDTAHAAWHDSHMMRQRAAEIDVKRYEPT